MGTNFHASSSSCRRVMSFMLWTLLLTTIFLTSTPSLNSLQSSSGTDLNEGKVATQKRRVILNKSAAQTAVRVTNVRNVEEENWWERLEIEVENVSNRPIYYLQVIVSFPDVIKYLDGERRGLVEPLEYGRRDLMRSGNRATLEDVPFSPGKTHVFKLPEHYKEIRDVLEVVKRISIQVYSLSFGDGTGFRSGVSFSAVNQSVTGSDLSSQKVSVSGSTS